MKEKRTPTRAEMIICGLGGQGILVAGSVLAMAAMSCYEHVVWVPSYSSRVRGGPSECTVILDHDEILSPYLSQADTVIGLDHLVFKAAEARVLTGGLMMVDNTNLEYQLERNDIRLLSVPALRMAVDLGDRRSANIVMLGAYLGATGVLAAGLVEKELERRYGKQKDTLSVNMGALRQGLKLVT